MTHDTQIFGWTAPGPHHDGEYVKYLMVFQRDVTLWKQVGENPIRKMVKEFKFAVRNAKGEESHFSLPPEGVQSLVNSLKAFCS